MAGIVSATPAQVQTARDKTMHYCLGELSWDKQQEFKQFETDYEKARKELETKAP